MSLTPEQLAAIAVRLGGWKLVPASAVIVQCGPTDQWYFEGRNADGDGFYPVWSDGDLLLAILNRAAEMGYRPHLEWCKEIGWNEWWRCAISKKDIREYAGQAHSANAIEAVALAFIKLPVQP